MVVDFIANVHLKIQRILNYNNRLQRRAGVSPPPNTIYRKLEGLRLFSGREQAVWEELAAYGRLVANHMLEWEFESENSNHINE